jgi:hypothetical protein
LGLGLGLGGGALLFSGDGKDTVKVWLLDLAAPAVTSAVTSESGERRLHTAVTGGGGAVVETECIATLKHPKGVYSLAVSREGRLATGCNDEHLRVWQPSIRKSKAAGAVPPGRVAGGAAGARARAQAVSRAKAAAVAKAGRR